jgi:deoxycytidylate deaminase
MASQAKYVLEQVQTFHVRASWIRQVIQEAEKSKCRQKHGALLIAHGIVVSKAHNQVRLHKLSHKTKYREALHAEVHAVLSSWYTGKTLITCRIGKGGNLKNGTPCSNCIDILGEYKIKWIISSNKEGGWNVYRLSRMH